MPPIPEGGDRQKRMNKQKDSLISLKPYSFPFFHDQKKLTKARTHGLRGALSEATPRSAPPPGGTLHFPTTATSAVTVPVVPGITIVETVTKQKTFAFNILIWFQYILTQA